MLGLTSNVTQRLAAELALGSEHSVHPSSSLPSAAAGQDPLVWNHQESLYAACPDYYMEKQRRLGWWFSKWSPDQQRQHHLRTC